MIQGKYVSLKPVLFLLSLSPGFILSGCLSEEHKSFTNEGVVCVSPESHPQAPSEVEPGSSIAADENIYIHVDFPPKCFVGCDEDIAMSCSARQVGHNIIVESSLDYTTRTDEPCEEYCHRAVTTCELSSALSEGTYTVFHGEDSFELVVPSEFKGCLDR